MNVGDVIRNIIIRSTVEGAQKTASDLKAVQSAHEAVAKSAAHTAQVTETSAKHQLSMANTMERLERRFNQTARAQFEYERVQKQVNAAVAQNPALQARANDVLARAAAHYGIASAGQSTYTRGMQLATDQAGMFAARLGPMGSALTAIGPAGIAAGAALGAAAIGGAQLVQMVNDLADRSGKMVDFAETTGLTTTALQALNRAGAEVGLNQEKVGTIVERFTTELAKLRDGEGDLFKQLNANNRSLLDQLASTKDVAQAWNIMSRAVAGATDQIERNRLVAAVAGRRNIGAGRLLTATDQAGGVGGLTDRAGLIIPDAALRRWDELGDKITITSQQAKTALASIFADEVLTAQLKFAETMLAIGKIGMDFKLSDDFKTLKSLFMLSPPAWIDRLLGGVGAQIRDFASSSGPPGKTGADDAMGGGVESNQANLALSRQYLAVQNQLTDAFNVQMMAITARTQEERIAVAVEQRRIELSKTNISDTQLATELERTRTLAVARGAASHRDAMASLSATLSVAQALTGQEKIAAQEAATYNELKRQGLSSQQAMEQAAMQTAIAEANVTSSVLQQVQSLEDATSLIYASMRGVEARVAGEQAYNNALRQGADIFAARELQEAVLANYAAKRRQQEARIADEIERQAAALEQAERASRSLTGGGNFLSGPNATMTGKKMSFETDFMTPAMQFQERTFGEGGVGGLKFAGGGMGHSAIRGFVQNAPLLSSVTVNEQGLRHIVDQTLGKTGSLDAAIAEMNKFFGRQGVIQAAPNEAMSVLRELFDLQTEMAGGDSAKQQQFLEQQIRAIESQPMTLENLRMIRELKDSLDSLRESTDALNSTIGLDPLFTQGHGYIGIGYNPHGGRSPRIPIDPNTEPFMPQLTSGPGATGPVLNTLPVSGSMTSPGKQYIDPRTGRPIFGMADGGMFMVGGSGGEDSKYVPLRLTPGELIEVTPPRELQHYGQGQERRPAQSPVINHYTFNFPPSRSYGDRRSQRHLTEGFGRAMAQAQ